MFFNIFAFTRSSYYASLDAFILIEIETGLINPGICLCKKSCIFSLGHTSVDVASTPSRRTRQTNIRVKLWTYIHILFMCLNICWPTMETMTLWYVLYYIFTNIFISSIPFSWRDRSFLEFTPCLQSIWLWCLVYNDIQHLNVSEETYKHWGGT